MAKHARAGPRLPSARHMRRRDPGGAVTLAAFGMNLRVDRCGTDLARLSAIRRHPNERAFRRFLDRCACCTSEAQIVEAIAALDAHKIKGLGPAAANLLYFLHPTLVPPFNTAIVRGYNALSGVRVKLGRWDEYLAMRLGILRLNAVHRDLLSNDLGAVSALLFDIGTDRYAPPPAGDDEDARRRWLEDLQALRATPGPAGGRTRTSVPT
jgi:type II restriction enzyme